MAFRLILWFHCRMYCLIYIIDCTFGEPRCSLHFRGGMSGKFEPAIKKIGGKKRDTLVGLVRGLGVEDFFLRAPASKSVTEQPCCCLSCSCPWEDREKHTKQERGGAVFHLFLLLLHSMRTCRRESRSLRDFQDPSPVTKQASIVSQEELLIRTSSK